MRVHRFYCLVFVITLILARGIPGHAVHAAGGQDYVGYSTGTDESSGSDMSQVKSAAKVPSESTVQAAKPEISITLDRLETHLPETAPAAPQPAKTQPTMDPSPPAGGGNPAVTAPQPRQDAPAKNAASPPTPPASTSPIMTMLENTLRGRYDATMALKARMPKKVFHENFDRAAANELSRKANTLLNQQGDRAGALEAYAAAYAKDKSNAEINGSYGYVLFRNGHFAQARDREIESLEIKPNYGAAWFVLGQIFGYLKQEDYAYASFVNTCLFTHSMDTTLGFLGREKDKYGEVCVQRAAARALETCRNLAAREAQPSDAGLPTPKQTRMEPPERSAPRIGKVNIRQIVLDSTQLPKLVGRLAKMEGISRQEREQRLDTMVVPMVTDIRALISRYAQEHGYAVVLPAIGEMPFRQQPMVGARPFSLVGVDPGLLRFLNTPNGLRYRQKVVIDDLTPVISQRFNRR